MMRTWSGTHPVTVAAREQLHGHRGVVLWFTGPPVRENQRWPARWKSVTSAWRSGYLPVDGDNVCATVCAVI